MVVKIEPAMLNNEMCLMFLDTLTSPFCDRIVRYMYVNFLDLVFVGEIVDEGLKKGRFDQGIVREVTSEEYSKREEAEVQVTSDLGRKYHPFIPYPQPSQFPYSSYLYINAIPQFSYY